MKHQTEISEKGVLLEVLERLKRLEEYCGLDTSAGNHDNEIDSMSISSVESEDTRNTTLPETPNTIVPPGIRDIISRIKDEGSRSMLLSSVLCHLQQIESCFLENEQFLCAIGSAMSETQFMKVIQPQPTEPPEELSIPKDLAQQLIDYYYSFCNFEGFKIPLEKSFLTSIPDLLEIPHVQLDCTSQIIYYTILLQGIVTKPEALPRRGTLIHILYRKCVTLSEDWLKNVKDTPADFFAAITLMSLSLECCNIDLSWKALAQACRISKALGYFSVDETPSGDNELSTEPESLPHQVEVERNRKRFEFWHILRTDCLFRMCFGKPTLIPVGSWKVNFPDPTINGIDHASSRFIQIHFIASMRLTLIVMKYLDWVDRGKDPDPVSHDATIDSFIDEVQLILLDWDAEGLLQMATNHLDIWFCVDVLFSTYKMLIVLYQSKECNRSHILPSQAVEISRKSVKIFQSLLAPSAHAFWGVSLVLFHQLIPFFILCLDIIGNPDHANLEEDLVSIGWISDHVEMVIEERVELKPVMTIIKSMATACQQTKTDRLARAVHAGA
ncbi:uncharacterized protein N7515_005587 [Penicillium bovifimosum]|uniref:Xylanolytic transcriptional activator regulatory domain-containing protein n=1 Tax=Penicillium bovifimosum TaxID=126998 RepID=A0A9W9GTF9_9EURO|nr:uncharacterized protein N7515_005587 [Penicillium bovifimosum]KAJ5129548.1 hypothetical protein N7515_005587 [Penicillium bovifimosum]